ncbi:hypothetical protein AA309_12020 [Microvirga vignae]|uniref:Uncharacterized protein n=1 Tax=Microvirga vignae TaxID=1225564 RepID=A0A0H1RCC5_9HYPH|nr:hypothetical protein [Microvirga vignae]KLK92845.1 hypothetical protein AA309_12020 [Microvirga vignae]
MTHEKKTTPEEIAERFGGSMEPWSGGDGKDRIRAAIAQAEAAEAREELEKAEARLRELKGEEPKA